MVKISIKVEEHVDRFTKAGSYVWTVPDSVETIHVNAIGGGASGEFISTQGNVFEEGENTIFGTYLTLKGGLSLKNAPQYIDKEYFGGNGEDSPFGEGGVSTQEEAANGMDAKGSGAGGAGSNFYNLSGFGGGAGESVMNKAISVQEKEEIHIVIGAGGNISAHLSGEDEVTLAGNGGDGCVEIRYYTGSLNESSINQLKDILGGA